MISLTFLQNLVNVTPEDISTNDGKKFTVVLRGVPEIALESLIQEKDRISAIREEIVLSLIEGGERKRKPTDLTPSAIANNGTPLYLTEINRVSGRITIAGHRLIESIEVTMESNKHPIWED